jgi:hypothetical protein
MAGANYPLGGWRNAPQGPSRRPFTRLVDLRGLARLGDL